MVIEERGRCHHAGNDSEACNFFDGGRGARSVFRPQWRLFYKDLEKIFVQKEKKAKNPRAKPSHPPTSEMVNNAIKGLKERGGSSLQAIKKFVAANYKVDAEKVAPFIKKYLKGAVASGSLVQTKGKGASGSFKLASSTSGGAKVASASDKRKPASSAASKTKKSSAKRTAVATTSDKASSKTAKKQASPKAKKTAAEKKSAAAASAAAAKAKKSSRDVVVLPKHDDVEKFKRVHPEYVWQVGCPLA
jgi:histone H1/5